MRTTAGYSHATRSDPWGPCANNHRLHAKVGRKGAMCEQGYSHMEQCHMYVELVLRTARVHVRTTAGYSHMIWSEPSGYTKVGPKGCERPVIVGTGALWEQPLV